MIRIYIEHGEAYGNLGDEAMLINALRKIEMYLGRCEFIIPVEGGKPFPELNSDFNIKLIETPRLFITRLIPPFWGRYPFVWKISVNFASFIIKHGLLKYLFRDLHKWHSTLRSCDIFYSVGAANVTDFCLGPCVVYKCWIYKTAGDSVKISAIGPQGIGPLHTPWARKLICKAFSKINFIALRDFKESFNLISNLKPDNVEINITGDEAFSLPVADDESINTYLNNAGISINENFIVIHFRATDYTKNTKYLAPKIANYLDCLVSKFQIKLLFIPMSYDVHSTIDIDYGLTIRDLLNNPGYMKVAALTTDTTLIKGVIGRGLFSFGLSYHIHVFSLSLGKPAIILYTGEYYKYKSEGLTGFYKFPVSSFNLDTSDLVHVLEAIHDIMTKYHSVTNDILSTNMLISDVNDWCYRKLKGAFD